MSRTLPEWIGKTPDTSPPPRVRARVFIAAEGRCHKCTRKIVPGDSWTLEHVKALVNGGQNRESNLDVTCNWCLPGKNAADVAEKSMIARKRGKYIGARKPKGRPMPGSRDSGWQHKMNGDWVRR